jgi:uncharacterized membrane-anchored protein
MVIQTTVSATGDSREQNTYEQRRNSFSGEPTLVIPAVKTGVVWQLATTLNSEQCFLVTSDSLMEQKLNYKKKHKQQHLYEYNFENYSYQDGSKIDYQVSHYAEQSGTRIGLAHCLWQHSQRHN